MLKKLKYAAAVAALSLLAACGGGGGGDAEQVQKYGAIATQQENSGAIGIGVGHSTQSLANAAAISQCRSQAVITINCFVRQEFSGLQRCGAIARGTNFLIGWATAESNSAAETAAVANCAARGGINCFAEQSACN